MTKLEMKKAQIIAMKKRISALTDDVPDICNCRGGSWNISYDHITATCSKCNNIYVRVWVPTQ